MRSASAAKSGEDLRTCKATGWCAHHLVGARPIALSLAARGLTPSNDALKRPRVRASAIVVILCDLTGANRPNARKLQADFLACIGEALDIRDRRRLPCQLGDDSLAVTELAPGSSETGGQGLSQRSG